MTEREPEGLDLSIQINFHTHVTASVRPGFAVQHLWTARRAAWLCKQREQYLVDTDYRNIDRQHRSHAVTAVLSAFAFVEAHVNDVVDLQQLAISDRTNPIDKCQDALTATGHPRLNTGSGTGQTFDVVRRLRNALVHYKPEWEHGFITGALYNDLKNRLKGRENRQRIGEPWFPNKAVGAGCAEWAVDTSVAFALQWHTAMGLDAAEFDRIYVNWSEPAVDADP